MLNIHYKELYHDLAATSIALDAGLPSKLVLLVYLDKLLA
jgi:hypothetical protein